MAATKSSKVVEENRNIPVYTVQQAVEFTRACFSMPWVEAPVPLWIGASGIGKTEGILEAMRSVKLSPYVIHMSQQHPLDWGGVGLDSSTRTMYFAKPPLYVAVMEKLEAPRGLFLDEVDRPQVLVQNTMLQLLNDKVMCGFKFNDTYIAAAANSWYCSYTNDLDQAFASRLCPIHVQSNPEEWLQWGASHHVHPTVLLTISQAPDILNQQNGELPQACIKIADPRAWVKLSKALHHNVSTSHAAAFVGEHAAKTFERYMNFSRDYSKEIKEVLSGKLLETTEPLLLFGVYMAAAGQISDVKKVAKFLQNSIKQIGKEKTYVTGRLITYRIPVEELLKDKEVNGIHTELWGAYKDA